MREEATKNLIKAGGFAFEAVTKATKSEDAEVKQRALRITKQFEKEANAYFKKLPWRFRVDHNNPDKPVTELILEDTKNTDAVLVHLKGLTRLHKLDLGFTDVTDAGLVHLNGLTKMQEMSLDRTQVTKAGVEKLKKSLPKARIWNSSLSGPGKKATQ